MMHAMAEPMPRWDEVAQIALGKELRLAQIPKLIEKITGAYLRGATRIELDATNLRRMTDGAKHLLAAAGQRLERLGVELVVIE